MTKLSVFRCVRVLGATIFAGAAVGAGAAACADVSVVDPEGVAPSISAVLPAKGPSEGGTPVVITGHDFVDGAKVRFGGELAKDVKWVDEGTLNALTPPGLGQVSVSVENPNRKVDTLEDAFSYEGVASGCAVVSTSPELGAAGVPVVGELRLTLSAPLDAASLQGAVTMKQLGGDEVPVEVSLAADTDSEILVRPQKSLRFWGSYAVVLGDGVKATDGSPCAPAALAFATIQPEALPRALRPAYVSGLAMAGSHVIAASEGYRGLQTYDATDPTKVALVSDTVTKFGPRNITVQGGRAYAASGFSGVQIFDVSDPVEPALLGHAGTPGRSNDVAIVEKSGRTFAVIADIGEGARVVEVTDPAATADVGTLALGGSAKPVVLAVDAEGDRIAVADGSRFVLIQMADPAVLGSQVLLGSLDVGAQVSDVLLDGDTLFVGKSTSGVASYDISNPAAPVLLDAEANPDGTATSLVRDGGDLFAAFGRGGVVKFSVDAEGKLTPVTTFEVPAQARSLAVSGPYVYTGGDEGLLVFDRDGDGTEPAWFDPFGHGFARTVTVREGFAYVGASLVGVQTFSLKDPAAPALIDRDDTPGSLTADVAAFGVATDDGTLAVGDGRAGITLFDLTEPANPALGGTVDTTDALGTVTQVGDVVFGCNGNGGVVAVDANDFEAPKMLGEITFSDFMGSDACSEMLPAGSVLYVARRAGLGVLDITDPAAMSWKKLVTLPGKDGLTSVKQVGTHLLATSQVFDYEGTGNTTSRLNVFDAADPLAPVLVWQSEDIGGAAHLSLAGDVAFVAAGAGVKVFDVSDIENPVLEGTIPTPGNAGFTLPGSEVLYAVQGAGGLSTIRTGPLPE